MLCSFILDVVSARHRVVLFEPVCSQKSHRLFIRRKRMRSAGLASPAASAAAEPCDELSLAAASSAPGSASFGVSSTLTPFLGFDRGGSGSGGKLPSTDCLDSSVTAVSFLWPLGTAVPTDAASRFRYTRRADSKLIATS